MNRILVKNNAYYVLITPTYNEEPSIELLLGNWTDEKLRTFKIIKTQTLENAMDIAFRLPSIDWNKIVNIHLDSYNEIQSIVKNALSKNSFIVEMDSHFMNPTEIKEAMFKRIGNNGSRYNLFYDANDIICINVINPWSKNLDEIKDILINAEQLRITRVIKTKTHISLIGKTTVGTSYEIRLWTSLFAQWAKWINHNNLNPSEYVGMLDELVIKQKTLDDGDFIR